jgi:hypothetical protein
MLTIFAIPKPFRGQFAVIQANAIRSWTKLRPRPEIILLGDDEGTAQIVEELGLRHIPDVARNEYGTPLVNDVFRKAQAQSSNGLMCYANADIILLSDFMEAVLNTLALTKACEFLLVGRKINIELNGILNFSESGWEEKLRNYAKANGKYVTHDFDFFVFSKGMFKEIPPFAIGRCFWTQWFIYNARKRGILVIDATPVVLAVESKHDYSHAVSTGGAKRLYGVEYVRNRRLFKGCKYFTTLDATHILTKTGLKKNPFRRRILSLAVRFEYYIYFLLKGRLYPYSLPIILVGRIIRKGFDMVMLGSRRIGCLISGNALHCRGAEAISKISHDEGNGLGG